LELRSYFTHLSVTHILQPGTSPREGIFNTSQDPALHNGVGGSSLPSEQIKVDRLVSAHVMPNYRSFLAHPVLHKFVQDFMAWAKPVLVTRTMLRHNVPGGISTGIHYDRIFLRAGEAEFLTAWVPIGDCSPNGGGLMYLEGSSEIGKAIETDFVARAKVLSPEERISAFNQHMERSGQLSQDARTFGEGKGRWLVANYEAGDVVFHDPYMIHGAVKNEDSMGRIRLSTDLRFYEDGVQMDERWMQQVWKPDDGL
jgi:phytanoyl-CoA hydroxylase